MRSAVRGRARRRHGSAKYGAALSAGALVVLVAACGERGTAIGTTPGPGGAGSGGREVAGTDAGGATDGGGVGGAAAASGAAGIAGQVVVPTGGVEAGGAVTGAAGAATGGAATGAAGVATGGAGPGGAATGGAATGGAATGAGAGGGGAGGTGAATTAGGATGAAAGAAGAAGATSGAGASAGGAGAAGAATGGIAPSGGTGGVSSGGGAGGAGPVRCATSADCPSPEVCGDARWNATTSVWEFHCIAPAPGGGGLGEPCSVGWITAECEGYVCLDTTTAECSALCTADADCSSAPGFVCVDFGSRNYCLEGCGRASDCEADERCVVSGNVDLDRYDWSCLPPRGTVPVGQPTASGSCSGTPDCAAGFCLTVTSTPAAYYCSAPCVDAGDCGGALPNCGTVTMARPVSGSVQNVSVCVP